MKRRPKGFGSVYKLSGNRSQPYVSSITLGNSDGRQVRKPIAYSSTYEEAEDKLYLYHLDILGFIPKAVVNNPQLESKYLLHMRNMIKQKIIPEDPRMIKNIEIINAMFEAQLTPYDINQANINNTSLLGIYHPVPTVDEIWQIIKDKELSIAESTLPAYESVYKKLEDIKLKKINEVNLTLIENLFSDLYSKGYKYYTLSRLKSIINMIMDYAEKHEYISRNFIKYIKVKGEKDFKTKATFSTEQIKQLIDKDDFTSICMLICIFTGMRPSELLQIKTSNVQLNEKYIIGGIKTSAGINRMIPLHDFIYPYIEKIMENNTSQYMININGAPLLYHNFLSHYYNKLKKDLKFQSNLTPHSGRKTFITIAKECDVNMFYLKCIVGHSHQDITEDVYTEPRIDRLLKEINKIKIEGIC